VGGLGYRFRSKPVQTKRPFSAYRQALKTYNFAGVSVVLG